MKQSTSHISARGDGKRLRPPTVSASVADAAAAPADTQLSDRSGPVQRHEQERRLLKKPTRGFGGDTGERRSKETEATEQLDTLSRGRATSHTVC